MICGWAMVVQTQYRVPGGFLFVLLPVIGLTLTVLSFILFVKHLLIRIPTNDPFRRTFDRVEWWSNLLVRVFVYYSLLLYINAKLDTSKPTYQAYDIVSIVDNFDREMPISYSWATLRHRDAPHKTERLLLGWQEQRKLWGAEPVMVTIREGFLGIPWVATIERDWDNLAKEILKHAPTASMAWKQLIAFDLAHDKWKEGSSAAWEYLKLYPNDHEEALSVGATFDVAFRYAEAVPFYEYAAARHPDYQTSQMLGAALSWSGNNRRAAEILEASVQLNPAYWEAYYHLGYVYGGMGKFAEGIAAFSKALERKPNFPEVEVELARLQQQLHAEQAAKQRRKSKGSPGTVS
jgi:tetratricopeptide (TPR) repeat protein